MSAKQPVTLADIVGCIEDFASPGLQEKWDNTGWQLCPLTPDAPCTGVMLCLDVTPEVVAEASAEAATSSSPTIPLFSKVSSISPALPKWSVR